MKRGSKKTGKYKSVRIGMHYRALAVEISEGLSLGPVLGGIMTQYLGWRSLFFAMIPLGVTILTITWWKMDDEWAASRGGRDSTSGVPCLVGFLFQLIILLLNNVYRIWVLLFLMAIAAAFFVPMMTTSFFPLVTPV